MDEQAVNVGKRIAELRKSYGYTQEKLAELADISIQFLVQIEHGQKTMKLGTLRKLSSALSVSTDYIVSGIEAYPGNAEANALLSELSEVNRRQAVKLLRVFVESVNLNFRFTI